MVKKYNDFEIYSTALDTLSPELLMVINQFRNDGFYLTDNPTETSVKMSQVTFVDPINDEVIVCRLNIQPNENYHNALYNDMHDYQKDERPSTILPYHIDCERLSTSSKSPELTNIEKKILQFSTSYQVLNKTESQPEL